ncbi:unnamed protein product [Allacma fusca]|uniref:Zinc finger CCCH domain-containing protein 15 n=1 Tax=Allacma fusca TaxID=39272 RepID=A0A8J2JUZ9_9HEXA|nr:unnamed protein product [Allacma fusca]
MPPKKGATSQPSKKTEQKKKDKVVEDKTFGLKNKKGAKQQKFIQQVQKQVQFGGNPSSRKLEQAKLDDKLKKKGEEDPVMSTLFKPVTQAQKIEKGADPKSVLCAFFKQGTCGKGDKCKFSHDLTIERKAEKRSLYCDMRDDEQGGDTMDQWDEDKLKEVVEKKHGDTNKTKPQTDIICRYFLDAVEKSKYGWFWECPNGENCHYRHALPSGFVLKKDKIKDAKKDEISLEDLIERERNALGSSLTKITLETFTHWKKRKIQERKDAMQKDEDKKRAEFRAGRQIGLSGREMFTFNPSMAADSDQLEDGDDAFDTNNLPDQDGDDELDAQEYKEISFDQLEFDAREVDDSGTIAANDRLNQLKISSPESEAGGTGDGASNNNVDVPIDENLFEDSDLPDSDDDDSEDS